MPAQWNNWNTSYTHIKFLENALAGHQRVELYSRDEDVLFRIQRRDNLPPINAVLVGRYVISQADVIAAKAEFPEMNAIVAYGGWCGYTEEAKQYGLANEIGVFVVTEFLGALWMRAHHLYTAKDSQGKPIYAYKEAS